MLASNLTKIIDSSIKCKKINHCYLLKTTKGVNLDDNIIYMINSFTGLNIKNLDQSSLPSNIILADASKSQGEGLKKDNIVDIFEQSNFSNFLENGLKIIVFKNIDLASHQALNALLKTIEEPANDVVFILTTQNINQVLTTIKSRSFIININKQKKAVLEDEISNLGFDKDQAWLLANVVSDISLILENKQLYEFSKINDLLTAFVKSFKDKISLIILLTKLNKREYHDDLVFLIECLKFILTWSWMPLDFLPKKFRSFAKKIADAKFNYKKCFLVIDKFLNSVGTNDNLFLQTETMFVYMLECYE
ncbi:DNA polymerase III subunit delta' [Mycoplasma zalophidermidis]|uniref:DNA polymerase III subunit delta n=1 Tax=Mycoplasma zalophidermidis TaxID=398174 RepID=A0ABS6DQT9_9MOLU|nr:DNA polymerase III subunit delta' [Mycoplasma zalophidermidis]MBU4689484.1 DNA polymerase III subunit delta' [Mycoplasma zalophidermidis]MBU4693362.1 DNA polymerase III subunit delta' [Mycoplasma zalophidermidis]MCR8966340.1 DNA polymerase III subunit delta' [Mycoplasma zalophidermidis]